MNKFTFMKCAVNARVLQTPGKTCGAYLKLMLESPLLPAS